MRHRGRLTVEQGERPTGRSRGPGPAWVGTGLLAVGLLGACAPAAVERTAPLTPPEPAAPSARSAVVPPPAPPVETPRCFATTTTPLPQDSDEGTGPAPCDFSRPYRGLVGPTKVSWVLRPGASPGDKLEGLGHYDRPGKALTLSGTRTAEGAFVLAEKPGGTFEGRCDAKGSLRGTFTFQGKKTPFELKPRPASWPALYQIERRASQEPNHPFCKKAAKRDEVVETSEVDDGPRILCLPTNPARKKEILGDSSYFLCSASETSYRVFGLADEAVEKRVNERLGASAFDAARSEIRKCHSTRHYSESSSLVWAQQDLLVVASFRSDDYGGAHPLNNGGDSTAIDLRTGARVTLDQLVDASRLRPLAEACLPLYLAASRVGGNEALFAAGGARQEGPQRFEIKGDLAPTTCGQEASVGRFLWACDKDEIKEPAWTLLPAGLVIGSWANPHVAAALDGQGPILPWSVLLRAGLLPAGSPVARLWAGVQAAEKTALPCEAAYEGERLLSWREEPAPRP